MLMLSPLHSVDYGCVVFLDYGPRKACCRSTVVKKGTGERIRESCGYLNGSRKYVLLVTEEGGRKTDGYLSLGHVYKFRELMGGEEGEIFDYGSWLSQEKRKKIYERMGGDGGVSKGMELDSDGEYIKEPMMSYF